MRRILIGLCLWACAAAASGCARAVVNTEVKADGSFTRTLTLRASKPAPDDMGFSIGPKLEDVFVLPDGAAWKVKRAQENDEEIYTAQRTLGKEETVRQDVVIKGKTAPMGRRLSNEVTVREVAPGQWEYREVLRWHGERPKELLTPDTELLSHVRDTMPKSLANDANVRDATLIVQREFWRMLFGPGEPLLSQILMHPDLAERRIKRRVGIVIDKALQERFGERITADERQTMARRLIASMDSSVVRGKAKTKAEAGPPGQGENESALVALTFVVKLPGKLLSTNGEFDEVSGEVFWALYPEAAAIEDLVLTATCEVDK